MIVIKFVRITDKKEYHYTGKVYDLTVKDVHSYNVDVMAQEIITDLLDEGLICYGGYAFKRQQKEHHSI